MHYGFYLTAFVDILGQRDELRKLSTLPHNATGWDRAIPVLKRTAGRVLELRTQFRTLFDEYRSSRYVSSVLSPQARAAYESAGPPTVHFTGFSDAFVISVPLGDDVNASPFNAARGVLATLYAVAGMSLAGLAAGIPLRAGLDIERGIDVSADEVYGLGGVNAYLLESKKAEYPRALVGKGLQQYLNFLQGSEHTTPFHGVAADFAAACKDLICEAPDDGKPMLHILSSDLSNPDMQGRNYPQAACDWVAGELRRFRAEGSDLALRYERLLGYFESYGIRPSTPDTQSDTLSDGH